MANASPNARGPNARLFRYQHIGIGNANPSRWGHFRVGIAVGMSISCCLSPVSCRLVANAGLKMILNLTCLSARKALGSPWLQATALISLGSWAEKPVRLCNVGTSLNYFTTAEKKEDEIFVFPPGKQLK